MNNSNRQSTAIRKLAAASSWLILAACGGGNTESDSGTATNATAASSASSSAATVTLGTCLSATPGKTFTTQYVAGTTTTTTPRSIGTGILNSISATTEIFGSGTDTSAYYSVYSANNLQVLGIVNHSSTGNNLTVQYSGYTIDLTVTPGESRSIRVTDGVPGDLVQTTYTFEGIEQLQVAGTTLTTCRVAIQSISSSATSSATSSGKFWYAAGYGFWGPVKEINYYSDGSLSGMGSLLVP